MGETPFICPRIDLFGLRLLLVFLCSCSLIAADPKLVEDVIELGEDVIRTEFSHKDPSPCPPYIFYSVWF